MKRAVALLVVAATALAACSSSNDDEAGDDLATADPGDCIVVDMASSPEKITVMTELAKEFNGSDLARVGDECVFVRPAAEGVGRGRLAAVGRLAEPRNERSTAGDLVARGERVGRRRQPAPHRRRRSSDHRAIAAVHADAARHRDASADGRGARLSREADRLRRHPRPGQGPGRLGGVRPSGVGAVPPRQDQPELLDERAQLHDRRSTTPRPASRAT